MSTRLERFEALVPTNRSSRPLPVVLRPTNYLAFSTSPCQQKKKQAGGGAASSNGKNKSDIQDVDSGDVAVDFADMEDAWARAATHFASELKAAVARSRPGGAGVLDVETLGKLPVTIKQQDSKDSKHPQTQQRQQYPLRELATIVPRTPRTVSILLHEKAYVRPVMSAVQASPDYNQQPQQAADNELELILRVEGGPAGGNGNDGAAKIKAVCNEWRERVRKARGAKEKTLQRAGLRPDDKRRADKELQRLLEKELKMIADEEAKALNTVAASAR